MFDSHEWGASLDDNLHVGSTYSLPFDTDLDDMDTGDFSLEPGIFDSLDPFALDPLDNDSFKHSDNVSEVFQLPYKSLSHSELQYSSALWPSSAQAPNQESPKSARLSDCSSSIIPENYGPGCWLSVCSEPGLAWVQQKTGCSDFALLADNLTVTWAKQLRLDRNESTISTPEPEPEIAWKYVEAFFDRSLNSLFEAVHRPQFEWRLRNHFRGDSSDNDPAWYALRNAVYATGCRLYHSSSYAASFTTIQEEASRHFSNALSVHSELLLRSPSVQALRALLTMVFFAEGLGSPALSSGLVANAAFLSQALGLHRKVMVDETMFDSTTLQQIWLFWSTYCFEKSVARRIGRPSVIDDESIGCNVPSVVHPSSSIDLKTIKYIIRGCQLSSRICKKFMSAHIADEEPSRILEFVDELDKQSRSLRETFPTESSPTKHARKSEAQGVADLLKDTILRCAYLDVVMVLHTPFAYPWITRRLCADSTTNLRARLVAQIGRSTTLVIEAARSIIIMARNFEINGTNTHSFMLYYPMHAFIILFVHVINNPRADTVRTDLALLDVAAGYFGRMDFVTGSRLSFPFARDIAMLGRRAVHSCPG